MITVDHQSIATEMGQSFQSLIQDRCCLHFKDSEQDKLYSSIQERIAALGLETPRQYYELLIDNKNHSEEWKTLLELLTINHTFFFRNKPQFVALQQKVLPDIIEQKMKRTPDHPQLTIWSAGCSTGQEPYSIAMTITELIEDLDRWHIRIMGTDISRQALNTAEQGIYSAKSVKDIDESAMTRYFNVIDTDDKSCRFQVKDHIRALVDFTFLNLADGFFPLDVDIVFCRNVIIYFDTPTIYTLTEKFENSLADQGYLFIGHSETLPQGPSQLKMHSFQEGIYYQKMSSTHVKSSGVGTKNTITKHKPTPKSDTQQQVIETRHADSIETLLLNIEDAVKLNEYTLANELIQQVTNKDAENCEAEYWLAQILMNQGEMDVAKQMLVDITEQHPFFVPAYYLLGLVLMHEQDNESAIDSFKRALYIDRHFVLARFALATTLRNHQHPQQARKEYKNTLKDVPMDLLESDIKYGNGLSYAMLVNICRKQSEQIEE